MRIIFLVFSLFLTLVPIEAQENNTLKGRIEGSFKFLPIPYLNYNRSIGFQLGAMPLAQFNPVQSDSISPSSLAGLFGMYSSNETYFLMGMGKLYFNNDNLRFNFAGGTGSVNFQFFLEDPVNLWIPYNTEINMFFAEPQIRVYERIYLGVSYMYIKFKTILKSTDPALVSKMQGLGLHGSADYRTNVYYPRNGFLTNIKYFTYPEFMGNEEAAKKIQINHNHFFPVRNNEDVVAARFFAGLGLGDLNFNQQFVVGLSDDIRGYSEGEYRGNFMYALQGEYRWNLNDSRFGFVSFFGLATVFGSINEDHNGKLLPGAGAGFRYTISEDTGMNVGMDIAAGKDDWGLYFRINEAFNR
jgi:outer membrane protein assembly factor BamA